MSVGVYVTHPGQSKVHLHLRHPLPQAGSHPNTKRDEAVRVVLVETGRRLAAAAAGLLGAQPTLRDKALCLVKLCLVVTDDVVTQMEQSLRGKKNNQANLHINTD